MNNNKDLIKKITTYSKIKTFGVLPFSILAIISTVFFTISVILSTWIYVPSSLIKVLAFCMMSGLIVPILALSISEKIRTSLITGKKQEVFLKYLELFAKNEVKSNFIYYDLVDLFRTLVTMAYMSESKNEENISFKSANNSMYIILKENSKPGLVNEFVYTNRLAFSRLCEDFIKYYTENDTSKQLNLEGILYNLYLEIKSNSVDESEKIPSDFDWSKATKVFLLLGCICTFPFPQFNSWIFNLVAIILLFLDIKGKPKSK